MKTIAEISNGIILAEYKKIPSNRDSYQTEAELEENLINDLINQGYERLKINTTEELVNNLKDKIEKLNEVKFTNDEWNRFLNEYLNSPNDGITEKIRKVQENHIYDFIFDNGTIKNIKIIDKNNINNNFLQVVNQVEQFGTHNNRYDVTILVNGLPLVHIELKKRGVNLKEAFNQIHRYKKESLYTDLSLYKFVQLFVVSNGTYTRYFANVTSSEKASYDFTCEWADVKNKVIHDLTDFTATFFEKRTILEILTKYCIFDTKNTLLVMRPYQIAATEKIIQKINTSYLNKHYGKIEGGGYIWHTTGSGKTLTSFKTANLATQLNYIDKVFFVVDRRDLDYQTMKEYQKFQKDSVNGSKDTNELRKNIEKSDNKIIVTTIQKLNQFIKSCSNHPIFEKHCVLIFDECHRSQFGEAQKNIRKKFKKYYQFGFTGTPIFEENALGLQTTKTVFGNQLHSYIITDAIRDQKVLKFNLDYIDTTAKMNSKINQEISAAEKENDEIKLKGLEKKILIHPDRISKITSHILDVFDIKTNRNKYYNLDQKRNQGYNAMFAVQSIEAAKLYYYEFMKQQEKNQESEKLRIATIFSYAPNEEIVTVGEIIDESTEVELMAKTDKEFLEQVIEDYNKMFKVNYSINGQDFENYYKDLSKRVKNREVDLIIVVGMFLTGFDSPNLNTLFVDKNLRYHGLIQAFSRTNRIANETKNSGNIVCFRDLDAATKEAIKTFGHENDINVILEKSYHEHMNGYIDEITGEKVPGYVELCEEMLTKFPDPTEIELDRDKKEFAKLFTKLIKVENILRYYDEFQNHQPIINEAIMQDMKSTYFNIKEYSARLEKNSEIDVDFSDVEFSLELFKSEEINLDYILALIFEKFQTSQNIQLLQKEVGRVIRSSIDNRAKEQLIIEFIQNIDLTNFKNRDEILKKFYEYAREQKLIVINQLIETENLNEKALNFILKAVEKENLNTAGMEFNSILPKMSRLNKDREIKKEQVIQAIEKIISVYKGV